MHYLYAHLTRDENRLFYVGQGLRKDRKNSASGRNRYWKNIAGKHGFRSVLLASGLDKEMVDLAEMEAIDLFRRRGIKLANMTEGGEGLAGFKHTEDFKRARAKQLTGNTYNLGRKHTEEQRQAASDRMKGNTFAAGKPSEKIGVPRTESVKLKISAAKRGVPSDKKGIPSGKKGVPWTAARRDACLKNRVLKMKETL